MKKQIIVPIVLLTIGLVALGLVAGIRQCCLDDLGGSAIALLVATSFVGQLLVLVSTWVLLSSFLPSGYSGVSAREARLGGLLVALPALVGVLNACAGDVDRSPLFVPLLPLNALAVSAAIWFLFFCVGHVFAREWPILFKVFWVVLLLLGNLIAVPVYWYAFVWRPHVVLFFRRRFQRARESPSAAAPGSRSARSGATGG